MKINFRELLIGTVWFRAEDFDAFEIDRLVDRDPGVELGFDRNPAAACQKQEGQNQDNRMLFHDPTLHFIPITSLRYCLRQGT